MLFEILILYVEQIEDYIGFNILNEISEFFHGFYSKST